ncbi:MAG: right-handed parallel beta-helix repeat-containing protein [Candidatus Latescibacteria bacterium]|nr:right-handed parallel beta-helix repeat-containing protein [Candidatus Latescibacterota bacterium]
MKKSILVFGICLLCGVVAGCGNKQESELKLYVSLSGDDSWSGKLQQSNSDKTDGPFKSLARARDAVRELKTSGSQPDSGITIFICEGIYPITETFTLSGQDSGTEKIPVTWRNYPYEKVHFSGGKTITSFEPVSDPAVLKKIDNKYRQNILQTDLKAQGINNFGDLNPSGGKRIELFFDGKFMTVARYPNEGWITIVDVPQTGDKMINKGLDRDTSPVPRGRHYGRFTYSGDRPEKWANFDNIWIHGYWTWDWSDQYLKVAKIDTTLREIYPAEPHHNYGYTKGQRYYFLNILEELDSPGEWYLDNSTGMLYFWPPSPVEGNDMVVSQMEDVMISLENTSFVTVQGIIFESSRGGAVQIEGGSHNKIAGCTFRNLGQTVVTINGGSKNGIQSCDINEVASGGVDLHGGDRKTLTPAGNYAVNNHIHDFGVRLKTYRPAIQTTGVGNHIAHNLIHDAPHCGIFLMTSQLGNDHIIEYNELHSIAKETGDVGAIYLCARDFTMRGNIVRYNYIHHIHGPGQHGVMAIYLDDFTSGTQVYGNICNDASRAILIGGGRDNTIENNVFIKCDPSIHVDARGLGWAKNYFENNNRFLDLMEAVNYNEPPYSERYPELLTLQDDDPAVPKYNKIIHNISTGGRWLDFLDNLDFSVVIVENNYITDPDVCKWRKKPDGEYKVYGQDDTETIKTLTDNGNNVTGREPGFINAKENNFRLKKSSPVFKLGFEEIPVDKIGLYIDEYRTSLPY